MDSQWVEQGIAALEAGNKALARQLLRRAIAQDTNDERAWLAMSEAVEDVDHVADCLRRVLTINPGNRQARSRLDELAAPTGVRVHQVGQPSLAETAPSTPRQPDPEAAHRTTEVPSKAGERGPGQLPNERPFYLFMLAWSVIWIGGSALFLAFGIQSCIDERCPSDLWMIFVPAALILIGVLVAWAMWSQRRGDRRAIEETATSRTELFGQRPQSSPEARAVQGVLRCEKCGRPFGPDLLDCPHRPLGTCPYAVEHPTVGRRGFYRVLLLLGLGVALVGLLLMGPVSTLATRGDRSPLCLVSACATPLGLLAVVLGGLALYGEQLTFTNAETGQMWKRYRIGGLVSYQATASALQPVEPAPQQCRPMRIPASVCALLKSENATHVFYMALLSLLSRGHIALQSTTTSRKYFGREVPFLSGRRFALVPGQSPSPDPVTGELEKRILRAVVEWSGRRDEHIRCGGTFRRRDFCHFLALEDLVYVVFEGEKSSPDYWLTHDVVAADAVQRGLGRLVGPLKSRFEPLPEGRQDVLAEYEVILDVHDRFKASQPDVASTLWANIKTHIERLEPTD